MEFSLAVLNCPSRSFDAVAVLLSLFGLSLALCSYRAFWLLPFCYPPFTVRYGTAEKDKFAGLTGRWDIQLWADQRQAGKR
jgi:hypothetical protein